MGASQGQHAQRLLSDAGTAAGNQSGLAAQIHLSGHLLGSAKCIKSPRSGARAAACGGGSGIQQTRKREQRGCRHQFTPAEVRCHGCLLSLIFKIRLIYEK
jgi:hypothetical protein